MKVNSYYYRDTWAEVRLDRIYKNVQVIKNQLAEDVKLIAVVKANGYGHGDAEIARVALDAGANFLAVAILDEAIALRLKGITAPILVIGAIRPTDAAVAVKYNISVTVFHNDWLMEAEKEIPRDSSLSIHIKWDSGMGRLGYRNTNEIKKAEEIINKSSAFVFEGIFTHFATADELDATFFNQQLESFQEMLMVLSEKPPIIHAGNSAVSFRYKEAWFNAVRLGVTMYGLSPSPEIKGQLPKGIEAAFSLHSKITYVKKLEKGKSIGYGATYVTESEEWVATIPIGYADGWLRKLQGQEVLVDGIRVPIVGRICMDQCMIKLPSYYPVGTEVVLIGESGGQSISVDEIAVKLDTINYEVVCMITNRVPRVYNQENNFCLVRNDILNFDGCE